MSVQKRLRQAKENVLSLSEMLRSSWLTLKSCQILKAPFILEQAVETGNSESMDISSMNLIWQ